MSRRQLRTRSASRPAAVAMGDVAAAPRAPSVRQASAGRRGRGIRRSPSISRRGRSSSQVRRPRRSVVRSRQSVERSPSPVVDEQDSPITMEEEENQNLIEAEPQSIAPRTDNEDNQEDDDINNGVINGVNNRIPQNDHDKNENSDMLLDGENINQPLAHHDRRRPRSAQPCPATIEKLVAPKGLFALRLDGQCPMCTHPVENHRMTDDPSAVSFPSDQSPGSSSALSMSSSYGSGSSIGSMTGSLSTTKSYSEIAITLLKNLKNLPTFPKIDSQTPTVTDFIKSLEIILTPSQDLLPKSQWYRMIGLLVPSSSAHKTNAEFVSRKITFPSINDWEKVKEILHQLDLTDANDELQDRYMRIRQFPQETIRDFNTRFLLLKDELGLPNDDKTMLAVYLKAINAQIRDRFEKLKEDNKAMSVSLEDKSSSDLFNTIQKLMAACEQFDKNHQRFGAGRPLTGGNNNNGSDNNINGRNNNNNANNNAPTRHRTGPPFHLRKTPHPNNNPRLSAGTAPSIPQQPVRCTVHTTGRPHYDHECFRHYPDGRPPVDAFGKPIPFSAMSSVNPPMASSTLSSGPLKLLNPSSVPSSAPRPEVTCYRCGIKGHLANNCRVKVVQGANKQPSQPPNFPINRNRNAGNKVTARATVMVAGDSSTENQSRPHYAKRNKAFDGQAQIPLNDPSDYNDTDLGLATNDESSNNYSH